MEKMSPKTSALILVSGGLLVVLGLSSLGRANASQTKADWPTFNGPSYTGPYPGTSLSAKDPRKQYSITMQKYLRETLGASFRNPKKKSVGKKGLPIVSREKPFGYASSRSGNEAVNNKRIKRSHHHHHHHHNETTTTMLPVEHRELDSAGDDEVSPRTFHLLFGKKNKKFETKLKTTTQKPINKKRVKVTSTTKRPTDQQSKNKTTKNYSTTTTTKQPTTKSATTTTTKPSAMPSYVPVTVKPERTVVVKLNKSSKPSRTTYSEAREVEKMKSQEEKAVSPTGKFECGKVPMFSQNTDGSKLDKMVHSTNAMRGEWPWVVQIYRCRKGNSGSCATCTGTLLNENWLITAGHCVSGFQNGSHTFTASFDTPEASGNGSKSLKHRRIDKTLLHPEYDDMDNDLALLRLRRQVKFGELIQPVCLLPPTRNLLQYSSARECFMLGYERLEKEAEKKPVSRRKLHSLKIHTEEPSKCNSDVLHETTMRIGTVCVGSAAINRTTTASSFVCQADSGGPNLCLDQNLNEWQLFGVTSYASQCDPQSAANSLSVDLSNYRSWIRRSIASG